MTDYPPRVEKSENIYRLWESGEGDMGELAIGLYDLTAHYKALWDDYAQLEDEEKLKQAEIEGLSSQLLDVQQECIALRIELEQLRVEGARADDC